ncbi:MAG TPA: flagellar biosynthetic protein FliO [Bacillota bacterium]|nr:flagellar biosynthetic protein FliO [Bacillota bacterium]
MLPAIWGIVRFLLAFAVVVFLAAMASRLFAARAQGGGGASLRLLGALQLGGGRAVAAVGVGHRVLVVGVGDKQVSLLMTLDDASELQPAGPASQGSGFAAALRKAVGLDGEGPTGGRGFTGLLRKAVAGSAEGAAPGATLAGLQRRPVAGTAAGLGREAGALPGFAGLLRKAVGRDA